MLTKQMSLTKKQHFVPKFFLRNFSFSDQKSDGFIWQYQKGKNQDPQKKHINNILHKEFYYEDENKDNFVENNFSKIEDLAAKALKKIHSFPETRILFSRRDKNNLSYFFALLLTRVGSVASVDV